MTSIAAVAIMAGFGLALSGLRLRADPRIRQAVASLSPEPRSRAVAGGAVAMVGRWFGERLRSRAAAVLERAGRSPAGADRLAGAKVLGALSAAALGAPTLAGGGPAQVVAAVILVLGGFGLPDFVVARRGAIQRARMEASVPPMLDLLSLSVAAGLTPRLALERVTDALDGPLASHLREARHLVSLGSSWREALRTVASRTGLRDLHRLAVTLERSERLGSPVSSHLRSLAREVRADRRAAAEERARRAPVLMLFPLVFLILPAFVLAAVVPAVLVAARGLS